MNRPLPLFLIAITLFTACIGDDFIDDKIDPIINITTSVDTLEINTSFQFESAYLNNIGVSEDVEVNWQSSDESILEITADGIATALALGQTIISAETVVDGEIIEDEQLVVIADAPTVVTVSTAISGSIKTTSSYVLEGDFTYEETQSGVTLSFDNTYRASTALPGLYIYLSNNKNSIANAFSIGKVLTFNGAHEYQIPNISLNDYRYIVYFCKPFNIKVGDGEF